MPDDDAPQKNFPVPGALPASAERPGGPVALSDLREAVRRGAYEIGRLREKAERLEAENERLREHVARLEEDPGAGHDGTALFLDDDPDALRERLDRFIEALDAHLE